MKVCGLVTLILLSCVSVAVADAAADVRKVTEQFYWQFLDVDGDPDKWVKKSKYLTPEFKVAYAKEMKSGDVDVNPINEAQDVPSHKFPYKATAITVSGRKAKATMTTKQPGWNGSLQVELVLRKGVWLINGINGLRGK